MSDVGSDAHVSPSHLIRNIVEDLFSYDAVKRKHILDYYFFKDATLSSPIMSTEGIMNIQYVYTVWQTLNRTEPTINNIVFDGHTAVVHFTQNISPCIFPSFIHLQVPSITTLHFRETVEHPSSSKDVYNPSYPQQTDIHKPTSSPANFEEHPRHPTLYSFYDRSAILDDDDDLQSATSYDSNKTTNHYDRHQLIYQQHRQRRASDVEEEAGGILKIYKQEDSWTLEGLLQSVPLISYWYDHILRLVMGKIVTATGDLLDAAIQQAERLTVRGQEIQRMSRDIAIENIEKIEEYRNDLQQNYLRGLKQWRLQQQQEQRPLLLTEPDDDRRPHLDYKHWQSTRNEHVTDEQEYEASYIYQQRPQLSLDLDPYTVTTPSDASSSRHRVRDDSILEGASTGHQYSSRGGLFR